MPELIVADAGPLIGLARTGLLCLLKDLYGKVLIPPQVYSELRVHSGRPGSEALSTALGEGWMSQETLDPTDDLKNLALILDPGEAEAILLAEQRKARFLLIDEKRGRAVARGRGLQVVGIGGVLLAAKENRLIDRVAPALERLVASEYRLSSKLWATILELAGETENH